MKKSIKRKYIIIFICSVLSVGLLIVLGLFIIQQRNMNFSKSVIAAIGGEQELKLKCVHQNSGDIEMQDGKKYEQLLTLGDIARIDKLCDCVVAKSYTMVIEQKDKLKQILEKGIEPEFVGVFQDMFMINYALCETEMISWLNKKYEPVVIKE